MMREFVRMVCIDGCGCAVVGEAGRGPQAVEIVKRTKPDLLLLDLQLPGFDGFTVIEKLRELGQMPRILIVSSYCDDYTVSRIEQARVEGFIDKGGSTVEMLREAIAALSKNMPYFSENFRKMASARHADSNAFDVRLSKRERTILVMIGKFLTDREIASQLNISSETVEKHRFNIQRELALKSRTELIRYARDHGFITMPV